MKVVDRIRGSYDNANDVINNEDATLEDIEKALQDLIDAINNLIEKTADKSNLIILIIEAEGLNSDDYVNGWDALIDALNNAKAVRDNDKAKQSEVDQAAQDLQDAIDNLEEKITISTIGDLPIGSIVYDDSWTWHFRTGDGYTLNGQIKPVEWIVVAKDHYSSGKTTLLTKDVIGLSEYKGAVTSSGNYVFIPSETELGHHDGDLTYKLGRA